MGNCSSSYSSEKTIYRLCIDNDIAGLKQFFDSPEGEHYDVFKIIEITTDVGKSSIISRFDCIGHALCNVKRFPDSAFLNHPAIELLKVFKEQIEKNNKNSPHQKKFTPPQKQSVKWTSVEGRPSSNGIMRYTYTESLLEKCAGDIDAFRFLLDNTDTFPLVVVDKDDDENNNIDNCPTILHVLCRDCKSIELLREYLSSGKILDRFKNTNPAGNKGMTARINYEDTFTPLETACLNLNHEAVQELCVANVGGLVDTACLETFARGLIAACDHDGASSSSSAELEKVEKSAISIVLTLLSQRGGAGEIIKNHALSQKHSQSYPRALREEARRRLLTTEKNHNKNNARHGVKPQQINSSSLHALLDVKFTKQEFRQLAFGPNMPAPSSLATMVLWHGRFDNLYKTLISNGCKQSPTTHIPSNGLTLACKRGDVDVVKKILVEYKFHEHVIDINRSTPGDGDIESGSDADVSDAENKYPDFDEKNALSPPLILAIENNHVEIVKILLDAGAEFDVVDKQGRTAQQRARSCGNKDIVDLFEK